MVQHSVVREVQVIFGICLTYSKTYTYVSSPWRYTCSSFVEKKKNWIFNLRAVFRQKIKKKFCLMFTVWGQTMFFFFFKFFFSKLLAKQRILIGFRMCYFCVHTRVFACLSSENSTVENVTYCHKKKNVRTQCTWKTQFIF